MAITTLSSPLSSAANKIVTVNSRSGSSLVKTQSEYRKFGDFLEAKTAELERIQLPDNKKIQKLTNINVVNTFGSAGGLLGGLLGGALDVGGLIRGFFPGEGKKVGSAPQVGKPKTKPVLKGGKLRLGGIRALGVTNALFAGLDFATGLAEGESIGKSAAGTSGALAGSLLGGVIGQSLIPIPGVGFVLGSMAGGFLGGYGADRAYDTVASQQELKAKQEAKLKEQKQAMDKGGKVDKKDDMLSKFDDVAKKFEGFVSGIVGGVAGLFGREEHKIEGYSEELSDKDSPQKTSEGELGGSISYGTGNAEFGETGHVINKDPNWIHGHFQGENPQSVINDTTKVVKALLLQGSPVYLNQPKGSIDLIPSKKYTDAELRNYVENARLSHTHSGKGSSIDVFVKRGTKVPVPLTDVRPTGTDYGGYGAGGNAGYIQGTRTWIGHLTKDSKAGISAVKGEIKGTEDSKISNTSPSLVKTGVKPGQITSTAFGQQGSTNIVNYGNATKTNIKGFIIVPGHIAGEGASGEIAATQKIAKNIVDTLQKKYPGVPIQFWNHRNYEQTVPGFTKEMNDLKKLESQGWEIIEIHMDASIESGEGKGRGVIVPFGGTNLNEFDTRFAAQKGSYDSKHRGGLGATTRGMTIVETGNIGPQALSALNRGDQSAVDFFSSDTIQIFEQLIKEGKIGGGYRAPQSQVTTPPPKAPKVNEQLSYNQRQSSTLILDRPSAVIATGGAPSRPTSVPASTGGGGGGTVIIAASTHKVETNILNKLLENTLV